MGLCLFDLSINCVAVNRPSYHWDCHSAHTLVGGSSVHRVRDCLLMSEITKSCFLRFCFCKIYNKRETEEERMSSEKRELSCDSLGFVQWCVYSIRARLCLSMCLLFVLGE